jgi:hypothetical protein
MIKSANIAGASKSKRSLGCCYQIFIFLEDNDPLNEADLKLIN